jgi:hypothetical protein
MRFEPHPQGILFMAAIYVALHTVAGLSLRGSD